MYKKRNTNEQLSFVTIFPQFLPVCYTKDVGMIPFIMQKNYGYKSKIVCMEREGLTESNIHGLETEFLDGKCSDKKAVFKYVVKHARKIDVLNLYHPTISNFVTLWIYKMLNRYGIAYIKLDIDFNNMFFFENTEKWKLKILSILQRPIDIISAESDIMCERYNNLFKKLKIFKVSDGFYEYSKNIENKKENILLTVARIGTEQKATDVLLEAFANTAELHNWNLRLVGEVDNCFEDYIIKYYEKYPKLRDRVYFCGKITNKSELDEEYEKASIFILPSRWESFGLVLAEALAKGCYLIISDMIPPGKELTCNQKFGCIVPVNDCTKLAYAIVDCIKAVSKYDYKNDIIKFSRKFEWKKICGDLDGLIKSKM